MRSEASGFSDPGHFLTRDRGDSLEVSVVVPNRCTGQLGNRRDDEVGDGDPVMQWAGMGKESLHVQGPGERGSVAGQLVQSIQLKRDCVVIARGLSAEQDL